MKTKTTSTQSLTGLLLASALIATPMASAQIGGDTFSYFYGDTAAQGAGSGGYDFVHSLGDVGYSSHQYNHTTGVEHDLQEVNSAQAGTFFGTNKFSNVISLGSGFGDTVGTGTDDSIETITSVTLFLYVTGGSPFGTSTFEIYPGENSSAGPITSFDVTFADDEQDFIAINIPLSVALTGFTIGHPNQTVQPLLNTATERHSDLNFRPGFQVNTEMIPVVVPEPSSLLLCALGTLGLLRRRRA